MNTLWGKTALFNCSLRQVYSGFFAMIIEHLGHIRAPRTGWGGNIISIGRTKVVLQNVFLNVGPE